MASPTLQFKRGLFVNLPALRAGEPGITTDKNDFYVGGVDGNKFFGSHRYWEKETGSTALKLKLVDKNGSNSIALKAPDTLAGFTTYTLPATPTDGYYLKTNATGELEWSSVTSGASFDGVTLNNTTFTGISSFSGAISATDGLDVTGGSTFDNINVTGVGTINHLEYNSSTTSGISTVGELYVGTTQVLYDNGGLITLAGIQTVDATTIATLETLLSLDPNDFDTLNVSGISTIGGLLDANAGLDVTGHTELDNLNVTGFSTFSNAIDADLLGNAGTATSLATGRNIAVSGIVTGTAYFDGTSDITIATTIQDNVIGLGTHTYGDYVKDVTGTANQISVSGTGEGASVVLSLPNDVVVGTSLSVSTLKTATIQHSNGTEAITIDVGGNVGVSTNLTVSGDLIVNGTTTQVNTVTLEVEDTLIELGMVGGNVPGSDLNKDLGLLFNYYVTGDGAKKASVYWDESASRITFASEVSEANSVLTATTYATVLAGGLEINNACTGGTDEVISCVAGELNLSNIVVDGGFFV